MEKIFCKFCGKEINASAGFCPFCGNRVTVSETVNKSDNTLKQETPHNVEQTAEVKPLDTVALVLGIVTIVSALLFKPTLFTICGIIGIVLSIKHRKEKRTTLALILCIVGILLGSMIAGIIAPTYIENVRS